MTISNRYFKQKRLVSPEGGKQRAKRVKNKRKDNVRTVRGCNKKWLSARHRIRTRMLRG